MMYLPLSVAFEKAVGTEVIFLASNRIHVLLKISLYSLYFYYQTAGGLLPVPNVLRSQLLYINSEGKKY